MKNQDKIGNELRRQYESFWYPCPPILVQTCVSRTNLGQPEVISWPSCDRSSLQIVIIFLDLRTHKKPNSEVRFWLSTPRAEETDSRIQRSTTESGHWYGSDFMTHGILFTHSRKWLGRVSRRRTSGVISGHWVTSGLSRTHKIGDFNFRFWPLGGARKLF